MNELNIEIKQQLGVISTNFDDIKINLAEQMKIYKELEVSESNKPERKKDIATLRKMSKAVSDKRIEVKKECLKPYTEFEEKTNELIQIINEPIGIIDNQVKEFEEKQRLEKIEDIKTLFCELIETHSLDIQNEIGLNTIYDNRWENATASIKSIKDEMTSKLNTIRDNVALINTMVSDKKEEALSLFWGDLDIGKAMGMITQYEQQKREIEKQMIEQQRKEKEAEEERQRQSRERELERERERVREEERARIRKEEQIKEDARLQAMAEQTAKIKAEQESMAVQKQANVSKLIIATYNVEATPEEHQQIEMYLQSIGVDYERVD